MSKASRQSLALLAAVNGSMKILASMETPENKVHFIFVRSDIQKAITVSEQVITSWKTTGNEKKNTDWIVYKMQLWDKFLREDNTKYSPVILTNVCIQICTDLLEKINNKEKQRQLWRILDVLKKISDYFDYKLDRFDDYAYADYFISQFYSLLDFKP